MEDRPRRIFELVFNFATRRVTSSLGKPQPFSLVPYALEVRHPVESHHLLDAGGGPLAPLQCRRKVRRLLDSLEAFGIFDLPPLGQRTPKSLVPCRPLEPRRVRFKALDRVCSETDLVLAAHVHHP